MFLFLQRPADSYILIHMCVIKVFKQQSVNHLFSFIVLAVWQYSNSMESVLKRYIVPKRELYKNWQLPENWFMYCLFLREKTLSLVRLSIDEKGFFSQKLSHIDTHTTAQESYLLSANSCLLQWILISDCPDNYLSHREHMKHNKIPHPPLFFFCKKNKSIQWHCILKKKYNNWK